MQVAECDAEELGAHVRGGRDHSCANQALFANPWRQPAWDPYPRKDSH